MNDNIFPDFDKRVDRSERAKALGHKSLVLWFTGLSGSGKSTIARALERRLFNAGLFAEVLDGDNIRSGINKDLGFSVADRTENIRRISEIAKLYKESGIITIVSFISPTLAIREMAKSIIGEKDFKEIFINAPLEVCEQRDVKGLYKKARKGEIADFTGISAPFEAPVNPDFEIQTHTEPLESSVEKIFNYTMKIIQNEI